MKEHLTKKEIIALAARTVDGTRESVFREHLDSCARCRETFEKLLSLEAPYYRNRVALPAAVRERIIEDVAAAQSGGALKRNGGFNFKKIAWGMLPAAALAVSVVVFMLRGVAVNEFLNPVVTDTVGTVLIDGFTARKGSVFGKGLLLKVEQGATAELNGSDHRLYIRGPGEIGVDSVRQSIFSGRLRYAYRMYGGTIVVVKEHVSKSPVISCITPFGTLECKGTRFMVEVTGEKATVFLFSGSLDMTGPYGRGAMALQPGLKYRLPDMAGAGRISNTDMLKARSIEQMRHFVFEHSEGYQKGRMTPGMKRDDEKDVKVNDRERDHERFRESRELKRDMMKEGRELRRTGRPGRNR